MVSHIKSRNAHTLFSPIQVSESKYRNLYINGCLQPRLLPFIQKHHSDINFQFMHNLSGAHHSIETIGQMNENLPVVNNSTNPQNVPRARQKENLWDILTLQVYEGACEAKTQQELISRIHLK